MVALSLCVSVSLAACGSALDPDDVARANGSTGQAAAGAAPGTGPGSAPPAPGAPAASAPGVPASGGSPGKAGGTAPGTAGGVTAAPSAGSAPRAPRDDCAGFKNQTGITDTTITIANVSDISGPIPGLFEASQDATRAYVAYFNSTSDICGRKLKLDTYDSRTDAGGDQQGYTAACSSAFAAVGSQSAFDSGGAATAQGCGLPDLRTASVTHERSACTTCFGAQSTNSKQFENAVPDFVLKNYPEAAKHAAMLYINAGAAAENGINQANAMTKRGMHFDYVQGVDVSEFNYAPYVQQMKDKGIRFVQWLGAASQAVRLAQAMKQQGFHPDIYLLDPTGYDPAYVESGGDAVEGTVIFMNFTPFEEASSNRELQTYLAWLQQVHPGAKPSFFGLFAWSAAKLFVERSLALGGNLSRTTLLQELAKVHDWTGGGMHSPQQVGAKNVGDCWRFIQLRGGRWVPIGGTSYTCHGVTQL